MKHKRRRESNAGFLAPMYLFTLVFLIGPFLYMILLSFLSRAETWGVVNEFTLRNYTKILEPIYWNTMLTSLKLALTVTAFVSLIGYPFGYFMAKLPPKLRGVMLMLVMIPFWTNSLMRLNAWMLIFQTNGPGNNFMLNHHMIEKPFTFIFTDGLVLLGLITNYLPFAVLPMYSSIEKLEKPILEASADLGAKPVETLLKVTLPLTFPGIFSAIILTFIPALGTYVITDMLGGGKVLYIGNIIKNQFGTIRNWPLGAALSVLLLVITALMIFIYSRFARVEDMEVV